MTVSSTANRNGYTGNDTTANYNYSFKIFQDSDLAVFIREDGTDTDTQLILDTDYSVNDAGQPAGGTIDLLSAGQAWMSTNDFLDIGYILTIRRVIPLTQDTDIRNQGDFYPEVHEDVFDRNTMVDQQLQDEIDRCVQLPDTVTADEFDPAIPATIIGGSSLSLVSNPAGDGFDVGPTVDEIANAQNYALAAQAARDAAQLSEANAASSEANAATSESNAATSESNAAVSEANAAVSEANAAASALLISPTVSPAQVVAAGGNISMTVGRSTQYIKVIGDGGPVTTDILAFTNSQFIDFIVGVIGTDDTNTVTIPHQDSGGGCVINGPSVTLGKNDVITFLYDNASSRYIEISRNF